jgi:gas vesicle protein
MSKKKGRFGGLLAGLTLGAGLGVLFAPEKGIVMRKKLKVEIDKLCEQAKDIDVEEVRMEVEEKLESLKTQIEDLDKEKVLEIAKEKGEGLKVNVDKLADYVKQKSTPVIDEGIENLRVMALNTTKEIEKKLKESKKQEV